MRGVSWRLQLHHEQQLEKEDDEVSMAPARVPNKPARVNADASRRAARS